MAEVPKVTSAGLYLDAQRFHGIPPAPLTGPEQANAPTTQNEGQTGFIERRKTPDRRKRKPGSNSASEYAYDTRQKSERRKSDALDFNV